MLHMSSIHKIILSYYHTSKKESIRTWILIYFSRAIFDTNGFVTEKGDF
jgi:hypothetical protein